MAIINVEFRKLETNFWTTQSYESSIFGKTSKHRGQIYWKECRNRGFYHWWCYLCRGKPTLFPVGDINDKTTFNRHCASRCAAFDIYLLFSAILPWLIDILGFGIEESVISAWSGYNNWFNRDYQYESISWANKIWWTLIGLKPYVSSHGVIHGRQFICHSKTC